MENIASITIKPGHLGEFFHNSREKETKNSIFKENKVIYDRNAKEALEQYQKLLEERSKKYTERTGQRLQKNTITLLSAVVNIKPDTTLDDLKKLGEKFEAKYGTKILQIAIHRDEGYVDEAGKKHINQHAHMLMMGIDENGYSVKKKFKIKDLREMQDWAAETLKMERGKDVRITKRKRLDTYEYKEAMKLKNKELIELKKDVKLSDNKIQKYLKVIDKKLSDMAGLFGTLKKDDVLNLFNKFLKSLKLQNEKLEKENNELKHKLNEKNFKYQELKHDYEKEKVQNKELFEQLQKAHSTIKQIKNTDTTKLLKENQELKLSIKDLQSEISNLRKQLIDTNKKLEEQRKEKLFDKEDYAYLSKLKKELKKDTMKEVYEELQKYKKQVSKKTKNLGIDF